MESFTIVPVGYITNQDYQFTLKINKEFIPALREMDNFSHINILWWCNLLDDPTYRNITEAEQPYKNGPAKMGIFATRSPLRPNPIALTVTPILTIDHEQGIIHVPYIDAEDGTPIIDIKPYHPSGDRVKDVSVPRWCSHWPEWYEDSAGFDWAAEFITAR